VRLLCDFWGVGKEGGRGGEAKVTRHLVGEGFRLREAVYVRFPHSARLLPCRRIVGGVTMLNLRPWVWPKQLRRCTPPVEQMLRPSLMLLLMNEKVLRQEMQY